MILNYVVVICGYLSVAVLLSCILVEIDTKYIDLKIKKDLTKTFVKLGLLILAIFISVSYIGLLLKLLQMI